MTTAQEKNPLGWIVVLVTTSSTSEAEKIGNALVEERLAACVNIVPAVRSLFHWQGKICDESETLLIIKSRRDLFPSLCKRVQTLHSYTIPEVIALPILDGSPDYLSWINDSTTP